MFYLMDYLVYDYPQLRDNVMNVEDVIADNHLSEYQYFVPTSNWDSSNYFSAFMGLFSASSNRTQPVRSR